MRPKRVYIRCRFQSFQVSSWFPCWKLLVLGFFHVHFGDVKNSMVSTHDLPSKWRIFRPKQTPQIVSQLYPHVPVDNDIGYKMYIYICVCVLSIDPNCVAQIPFTNDLDNDCQIDKWAVFKTTNMGFWTLLKCHMISIEPSIPYPISFLIRVGWNFGLTARWISS